MKENKTILIIDDSDFDRSLLKKAIHSSFPDFKILELSEGKGHIDLIKKEKINLVLLDILMPGEEGTKILEEIRKEFNPIHLPVLMITAKSEAEDIVKALKLGANDYITKPINPSVTKSKIFTHLKLAQISEEMQKLREVGAMHAMVTTYNHEINNPLSIALGSLESIKNSCTDKKNLEILEKSLWRLADIVKKIQAIEGKSEVQFEDYAGLIKMVKLK